MPNPADPEILTDEPRLEEAIKAIRKLRIGCAPGPIGRVQTPGYVPKKTWWVFLGTPT